jgi:hypothetical protein
MQRSPGCCVALPIPWVSRGRTVVGIGVTPTISSSLLRIPLDAFGLTAALGGGSKRSSVAAR